MRQLWTQQINAAAREHGSSFGPFVHNLRTAGIVLNRKVLAEMAQHEPRSFAAIIHTAKHTESPGEEVKHKQLSYGFAASNA